MTDSRPFWADEPPPDPWDLPPDPFDDPSRAEGSRDSSSEASSSQAGSRDGAGSATRSAQRRTVQPRNVETSTAHRGGDGLREEALAILRDLTGRAGWPAKYGERISYLTLHQAAAEMH